MPNHNRVINQYFTSQDNSQQGIIRLKKDEDQYSKLSNLWSAEDTFFEALHDKSSLPEILNLLCKEIEKVLDSVPCSIYIKDKDGTNFQHIAATSFPRSLAMKTKPLALANLTEEIFKSAVDNKGSVIISDISVDPLWKDCRDVALEDGLKVCVFVPIINRNDDVLGTFAMYYRESKNLYTNDYLVIERALVMARIAIELKQTQQNNLSKVELLTKNSRYEQIIRTVTRDVYQSIDLEKVLQGAVDSMQNNIDGVDNVFISLVEGKEAVLKAHRGYPDWFIEKVRRIPYPKGATWNTIISGKPTYCADTEKDSILGPAGKEVGTKSYVSMPIKLESDTIGCININSFHKNIFNKDELSLLDDISQHLGIAINNAKRTDEIEKRNRDLEIVNYIIKTLHSSLKLEEIYRYALDITTDLLEYVDMSCIYLVEQKGGKKQAVLQSHSNLPANYRLKAGNIPYPKGLTWKVIDSGEIINISDVQKNPYVGQAGREVGHHSVLGIPIIDFKESVIGVIWFMGYKERKFTEQEQGLLMSIGTQIAMAIAKAKMYDDIYKKNKYEKIYSSVLKSIHSSTDFSLVLENTVDAIFENMDLVDTVSIYLVEGKDAVLKAQRGYADWLAEKISVIPKPEGYTWKTILEGKIRTSADVDKENNLKSYGNELSTRSFISIPVKYDGGTIGVLNVNSFKEDAFNIEELNLLKNITQQVEVAITKASQAEALRESKYYYRTLFDQSPFGVCIYNSDLKIVNCNERFDEILKLPKDKVIGFNLRDLRDKSFNHIIERAFQGEYGKEESFYEVTANSERLWLTLSVSPLRGADGNVAAVMGIVEDITQKKIAEQEFIKSMKFESLGALAGGLAHDLNNFFTIILAHLSFAKRELNKEDQGYKRLLEAEKTVFSAAALNKRLSNISRAEELNIKPVYLFGQLIEDILSFSLSGLSISSELNVDEDLWTVNIDEGQIGQVLTNLVINAGQAMPKGGIIRITARNKFLSYQSGIPLPEGRYVRLEIQDEGHGIKDEHIEKIFDPYFTNKKDGKGLGLYMCYLILKNHGGHISVRSEVGVGTSFYIYLPAG